MHIILAGNTITTERVNVEHVTLCNHHATMCPQCFVRRRFHLERTSGYIHRDVRCDVCRRVRDCATVAAK
jgi:hypothetical protein